MAQAILADTFPPQKRGLAFALYGITAVMAPTIGPTLGGWITDNYSWRWIFYINLPIGILTLFLVSRLVEDPPYLKRSSGAGIRVDYIGIALLALGVGALQVVLDKGQEDDWFGSRFILTLSVVSAICLISLVLWEWFHRDPVIDVRLFKNFNFATANLMMFMLGVVYFSSLVMMPQFLQTLMGYTAQLAGLGSFGKRNRPAGVHADRRAVDHEIPGQIHHCFWLALRRDCNVLFHQTDRSEYQLPGSDVAAGRASCRPAFSVRADHAGQLHGHPARKRATTHRV